MAVLHWQTTPVLTPQAASSPLALLRRRSPRPATGVAVATAVAAAVMAVVAATAVAVTVTPVAVVVAMVAAAAIAITVAAAATAVVSAATGVAAVSEVRTSDHQHASFGATSQHAQDLQFRYFGHGTVAIAFCKRSGTLGAVQA